MIRIVDERGSGKTIRLMGVARDQDAIFVCSNPQATAYKAQKYGIEGLKFASYDEFSTILLHGEKYVIDEIEKFTQEAFGNNLVGYTLTIGD